MTEQVAGLTMSVDVTSVDAAAKSLKSFKQTVTDTAGGLHEFVNEEVVMKQRAKEAGEEVKKQSRAYDALVSSIDPTISKMQSLKDKSRELDKLWSKGIVPDEDFFRLGEIIDTQANDIVRARARMTESGREAAAAEKKAAAEMAAAARQAAKETTAAANQQAREAAAAARQEAKAASGAAREKERAANAGKRFVQSLEDEVNALGKTRAELLEIKAAQMGVSAQASPFISQLKSQEGQMKLAGISAGQYSQAMRNLPAQITDVATSLAGGMPIWMVAIQQGGQIKDSFGGVGNVFSIAKDGVLEYVGSLGELKSSFSDVRTMSADAIARFGRAATIFGGVMASSIAFLGYSAYSAYNDIRDLEKAIISTGGYAFKSASDFKKMSDEISESSFATNNAIEDVMLNLVKSGRYTSSQIKAITSATAEWSEVSGDSAESIIEMFDKISKDPVKGLLELNRQMNFLKEGDLTRIKNLKDVKGNTEAVSAANEILANVLKKQAKTIYDSSSPLEKMWTDIKDWSGNAWEWVGQHTVGALNLIVDTVQNVINQVRLMLNNGDIMISEFLISANKAMQNIPGMGSFGEQQIKEQEAQIAAMKKANADYQKEIDAYNKRSSRGEMGYVSDMYDRDKQAGISAKTKDAVEAEGKALEKNKKTKQETLGLGVRIMDQYQQDIIALDTQYKMMQKHGVEFDKFSKQRQDLWERQARFDVLEQEASKRKLTNDEKSELLHKNEILSLAEQRAIRGDLVKAQDEELKRMKQANDYIVQQNNATVALSAARRGMGTEEQKRLAERDKMEAEWKKGGGSTDDKAFKDMIAAREKYYAEDDAKRADWLDGASNSFQDWGRSATDMYANVGQVATAALDGLSSQLTDFLTTGKASFADFAKSIIGMIIKMIIQMTIFNAISGFMGGAKQSPAPITNLTGKANGGIVGKGFAGGGFTGAGGKYEPAGLVHRGEFVFTKEATKRIGVDNLYKLMRGYANGGSVGNMQSIAAGGGGVALNMGGIEVNVNNGNDPKGLESGVRAIVNDMMVAACSQGGKIYNFVNEKVG